MQANHCKQVCTFLIGYRSGGTPDFLRNLRARDGIAGRCRGSSACQRPGNLPALRVACRCSPVGFDRQHTPPAAFTRELGAHQVHLPTLKLTAQRTPRNNARTRRNLSGGRKKMNSDARGILRSNARCRTPLSNSTRKLHHRSTTGIYSPMDAPTTHHLA